MADELPYVPLSILQEDVTYAYGPDSSPRAGTHPGTVVEFRLSDSEIYPGTSRRVWIHTPHGHRVEEPAAVMFFNDGWWYLDPHGDVRAGVVLDNLAAASEIPAMVGVFVEPGIIDRPAGAEENRNAEYDAFDSRYSDFLCTEVLPFIEARYSISTDSRLHGICGGSSGANGAFTAAWMRPDRISRVIGFNSSFAQMPGGNPYRELIGQESTKPLRVFLQAAHRDLNWNGPDRNWFAETLRVAAALAEAGYDLRLILGDGDHSPNHGGVVLPDAMRWLWRET